MSRVAVVTGASGFVGSAVLRRMSAEAGFRVIGVSRSPRPETVATSDWVQSCFTALSPADWSSLAIQKIDALLHVGAYTPKSGAQKDNWEEIAASNVIGLQRLLQTLPAKPQRIVFCSTLDVYAETAFESPIDESAPTGPAGLYGMSKLFGESIVRTYAAQNGCEHAVLRLGHVYGPGEDRYAKLIPETIRRVLRGEAPQLYGNGSEERDLLYVNDAAEAIVRAATLPLGADHVVNVARGESVEVRRIVELIAGCVGYAGPLEVRPAPARLVSIRFDTRLMRSTLGSWEMTSLAEGLRHEVAWFRARL